MCMKVHQGVAHNHGIVGSSEAFTSGSRVRIISGERLVRWAEDGKISNTVPDQSIRPAPKFWLTNGVGTGDAGKRHVSNRGDSTGCRGAAMMGFRIDGALPEMTDRWRKWSSSGPWKNRW